GDARAHQRPGLDGREAVGDRGQHAGGRDQVVGVAAVVADAGDLERHLAGHEVAAPAGLAVTAVSTVPAHAHPLADTPPGDSPAERVDDTGHLVPRRSRELDARKDPLFRDRVAVTDPARLHLDAHGSRAGRGIRRLGELEGALRAGDAHHPHGFAHRMPPAMSSVSPVIHAASSEARNTAAGAISRGWPMRPSGVRDSMSLRISPSTKPPDRAPSVSTMPGLIAFTRMLRGPSSEASVRVSESTAALVAL